MEFSDIRAIISCAYNLHKGNCLETTRRSVHRWIASAQTWTEFIYFLLSFFFVFFSRKKKGKKREKEERAKRKDRLKGGEKTISLIDIVIFENLDLESSPSKSINAQSPIRRRICDSKSIEDTILLEMDRRELYRTKGRQETRESKLENFDDEIITAM